MQLYGWGTLNDGATALVNSVLPGDGRTGFCGSGRAGGVLPGEDKPQRMIGGERVPSPSARCESVPVFWCGTAPPVCIKDYARMTIIICLCRGVWPTQTLRHMGSNSLSPRTPSRMDLLNLGASGTVRVALIGAGSTGTCRHTHAVVCGSLV